MVKHHVGVNFVFQVLDDLKHVVPPVLGLSEHAEVEAEVGHTVVVLAVHIHQLRHHLPFDNVVDEFAGIHCLSEPFLPGQKNDPVLVSH